MPDIGKNSSDCSQLSAVAEPNERIKQLSTASSNVPFDPCVPIKRFWRSGKELLRMANVYKEEQSLEKAFILYMKYITLFIEKIPQHPEYKTCDPNEKALTKTNCKTVFPIAEQLKSQLRERYQKEYDLYLDQLKRKQLEDEKRSERERQELMRRLEEHKEKELKELQKKLDQQIDQQIQVKKDRPEDKPYDRPDDRSFAYFEDNIPKPSVESQNQITSDLTPLIDRSTKPSVIGSIDRFTSLSRVIVPQKLIDKFLATAQRNTSNNIETCAILAGKLGKNELRITHVIVPKQIGSADSCQTENEEEVFLIQDNYDLISIGWIHTHPTQSAFMSSIDLHTHYPYQLTLPEAIAIVCAPQKGEVGIYSLTIPYGLQLIASCTLRGFHPHPTQPPIYEKSSHISFETTSNVELIDLR